MRVRILRGGSLAPIFLLGALMVLACTLPQLDQRTLYEQLGGEEGVQQLADRFVRQLATDDEVAHHFKGIDARLFRDRLAEQFCVLGEGPCVYQGGSMLEVHRGMEIDDRAFNRVAEDLILAMESLRYPTSVQNRLLAKLIPMHRDIVTRHAEKRHSSESPHHP